jgi:hypothetical protein
MNDLRDALLNKQLRSALSSVGYKSVEVGEVGGDAIYTSQEIKQKFISSVSDQDTFKPIMESVIRLIDLDVIIPVQVRPGLLKRIIYQFFKEKKKFAQSSFCMAFFQFNSGKIFVLVENIENIQYWKKSEALSLILLHEFQHMTAAFFPTSFMKLHSKPFATYYKRFIKLFFNVDLTDRDSYKLANWIHIETETNKGQSSSVDHFLESYHNLLWTILKPNTNDVSLLKKNLHDYLTTLLLYYQNPSMYLKAVAGRNKSAWKMYTSLKESYKSLKIVHRVDSLCIQEIVFPSEIICVESEYNTQNRHLKLITQIKK